MKILKVIPVVGCLFLFVSYAFPGLKEENSLRIMSYNVRNCRGMDEKTDYDQVATVINRALPDVVALQELDSASQRSNGAIVLDELAKRTCMYPSYGAAIDFQGGKYGIGMLSKQKPLQVKVLPLPGREEKRALLIAEFDRYYVCCTHFSLTKEDRLQSVSLIFEAIKDITKPLFLAGDMNSAGNSPVQRTLQKKFTVLNDVKQPTFPSDKPVECIDYIYAYEQASRSYSVLSREVMNEPLASDHRPLYADVRLKADKEAIFRTKPYLQNPTDNGMTVSWFTNVPVHSWVEYGSDGRLDQRAELIVDGQVICNNKHHKIRLKNLQPGATYQYRVCSREILLYEAYKKEFGETVYSDVYSFTMPSVHDSDFTAVVFNDIHKNNALMGRFAEILAIIPYDFVVFNGDCIDDPKNESEAVGFLSYMNNKVHAEKFPVFYMRGNHEIRNAYSIQLRELFDYVGDKTYGAFNWGDTRFVMLDCGEDKPDSTSVYYGLNDFEGLRKDQVVFLRKELESDSFKKAERKILIHHIPIYGMPKEEYNPCLELWGDLLSRAPFDVCLNAHTHRFAYHPSRSVGNHFPVVIGGGNRPETATMMILQKKGKSLSLRVLDINNMEKLNLDL